MTDERFRRWLKLTEAAVAVPETERAEALIAACREREELRRSLLETPPADGVDSEISEQLARAEARIMEAATAEHQCLGERIRSVRAQKESTSAYRPARTRTPVFLSRKA